MMADKVQFELERLGILVNRPSKRSVFEESGRERCRCAIDRNDASF